jgi:hypothetical protein
MYPSRPTREQIMRARRQENERWTKLQAARAELESHMEEHEARVLTPAAASLIAKIDECERQEVARWNGPPRPHVAYGVLREDVREPHHHPTGWISRLFWWRYGS